MRQLSASTSENKKPGLFEEIGTPGLDMFYGILSEAYINELQWPSVEPVYTRMWRSDPEVAVARLVLDTLASQVEIRPELPDNASDDDLRAAEFVEQEFDNLEGGIYNWLKKAITTVPFYGWGWWEIVPAMRKEGWRPPDKDDEWRSTYNDGLVGARRLAFRSYSSFNRWEQDSRQRATGFVQYDHAGHSATIPANRSVHLTFGDVDSPEGLATLEAMYRLERYKYGLEVIMGIGFEHSAGYLNVNFGEGKTPSSSDIAEIKKAARAILSAQEGNYALWPTGVTGEVKDVTFSAAQHILEASRYYGLLKLQLLNMQWVSIAVTAGTGAYAAAQDSSAMGIMSINAMIENFTKQLNDQYIRWLFRVNKDAFPGLTRLPKVTATKIRKNVDLTSMTAFLRAYNDLFGEFSVDDVIKIRTETDILTDTPPSEPEEIYRPAGQKPEPEPEPEPEQAPEDSPEDMPEEAPEDADLSLFKRLVTRILKRGKRV